MRVVVTGASGFVGQALCPLLRARGFEVAALERAAGDVTAIENWEERLAGSGAVVHLAALAHAGGIPAERLRAVNVDAAARIGYAAARAGARMIFASSVKVHGEETTAAPFSEASPLAPGDDYAGAKADAETALRSISGLTLTVLRPPLVYGAGVKANFHALLRAIARGWPLPFDSIANRRSLLYVGNLCDAVARCLAAPQSAGRAYLLSDGEAVSTPGLCRALGAALGRPARLFGCPPGLLELVPAARKLTRSLVVDDAAIRRELGWTPPHSLDEGLRRTAEWLRRPGG